MPKSKEPRAPARHPQPDSATPVELTPAERARAIVEQRLAHKKNGPLGGFAGGVHKPGKGGWSPPPIRPGGRGRRG